LFVITICACSRNCEQIQLAGINNPASVIQEKETSTESCGFTQNPVWKISFENAPDLPVETPAYWSDAIAALPSKGSAVYTMDFSFKERRAALSYNALAADEIVSASRIFLNGTMIGNTGTPGKTSQSEIPYLAGKILSLPPGLLSQKNRLTLEISNFHSRGGGIFSLRLGNQEAFQAEYNASLLWEGILAGLLFSASIFFFLFYLTDTRMKAHALFALFTFLTSLRGLLTAGLADLLNLSATLSSFFVTAHYLIAFSLLPPTAFYLLYHLFPSVPMAGISFPRILFSRKTAKRTGMFISLISGIAGFFLLFTLNPSVFGAWQRVLLVTNIFPAALAGGLLLLRGALLNQKGWKIVSAGSLALVMAAIHDVYITYGGSTRNLALSAGSALFSLSLALTLASRHGEYAKKLRLAKNRWRLSFGRIRNAEKNQDRFLTNTARLLRAPAEEAAELSLKLLEKEEEGPQLKKSLFHLLETNRKMTAQLDRLLQYAERKKISPCDSIQMPDFFLTQKNILEAEKNITIRVVCSGPFVFFTSPADLLEITREIADNAARHSLSRSLEIELRMLSETRMLLVFRSNGIAATEKNADGFGLEIVRRIVERNRGSLSIHSSPSSSKSRSSFIVRMELEVSRQTPEDSFETRHLQFLFRAGLYRQFRSDVRDIENRRLRKKMESLLLRAQTKENDTTNLPFNP